MKHYYWDLWCDTKFAGSTVDDISLDYDFLVNDI